METPLLSGSSNDKDEGKDEKAVSVSNSETSNLEFRKNWELSFLMAALICLFFSPLVFQDSVGALIFGKEGCEEGGGICGLLASPDLDSYWPNVVQLMFFTVYLDLGNTVKLAWQGLVGTAVVGLNVYIMALLFPVGGKCNIQGTATERLFGVAFGLRKVCKEFEDENYGKFQWFVWLDVLLVIVLILGSNIQANTRKFALSWHASFMMGFMSPAGSSTSYAVAFTTIFAVVLAIMSMLPLKFRLSTSIKTSQGDFSKDFESVLKNTNKFIHQSISLSRVKRRAMAYDMEHRIKQLIASYKGMGTVYEFSWYENVIMCNRYGADRGSLWVLKACIGDFQGMYSFVDKALMVMLKAVLAESNGELHHQLKQEDKDELQSYRDDVTKQVAAMNKAVHYCLVCLVDSCANTAASDAEIETAYEQFEQKAQEVKEEREKLQEMLSDKNSLLLAIFSGGTDAKKPLAWGLLRNNLLIYVYACLVISCEASEWPKRWKSNTKKFKETDEYLMLDKQFCSKERLSELLHAVMGKVWIALLKLWGDMYSDKVSRFHIKVREDSEDSEDRYWCPFWIKIWNDEATRSFVWTNTLAIYLAFILGNVLDGSIWQPYQPTMAATLGILISSYSGAAVRTNFMRLLGIILGKVTPIMLVAFIVLFRSKPDVREDGLEACVHTIVMFLYMAFFANVYYTSPRWSLVGCLTAGFGCYSFASDHWSKSLFAVRYMEIGQVTFAILLQMCIDLADRAMHHAWARDRIVENLKQIGVESNAQDDAKTGDRDGESALLIQAFHNCFKESFLPNEFEPANHLEEMSENAAQRSNNLQSIIEKQRALADECGEDTIFVASARGPFKLQLLEETLPIIEQLKVELDICYLVKYLEAVKSPVDVPGEHTECFQAPGLQHLERTILDDLPSTFSNLCKAFEQEGTRLAQEHDMRASFKETDFEVQPLQLNTVSLSMCVAKRSMRDIWTLICGIKHAYFSNGYLQTDFGSDEDWL